MTSDIPLLQSLLLISHPQLKQPESQLLLLQEQPRPTFLLAFLQAPLITFPSNPLIQQGICQRFQILLQRQHSRYQSQLQRRLRRRSSELRLRRLQSPPLLHQDLLTEAAVLHKALAEEAVAAAPSRQQPHPQPPSLSEEHKTKCLSPGLIQQIQTSSEPKSSDRNLRYLLQTFRKQPFFMKEPTKNSQKQRLFQAKPITTL